MEVRGSPWTSWPDPEPTRVHVVFSRFKLARGWANLSSTITFSDDTMGKHSRTFTTPRVAPFLFLSISFLFYYPLNVQPRFQTTLQTPLHLAFFLALTLVDGGARGTVSLNSSSFL